jgi:hypothetical protein
VKFRRLLSSVLCNEKIKYLSSFSYGFNGFWIFMYERAVLTVTVIFSEFLLNARAMQANVRNACKMLNRLTRLVCGEKLSEYSSWKNWSFKYLNGWSGGFRPNAFRRNVFVLWAGRAAQFSIIGWQNPETAFPDQPVRTRVYKTRFPHLLIITQYLGT